MKLLDRIKEIAPSPDLQKTTFLYTCIIECLGIGAISLLWRNPLLLTLVLIIASVFIILIGKDRKKDTYLYIAIFFIGPLFEAIAIFFGAWEYSLPNIVGIPIWLPFAWASFGVFIKRIDLEIVV